MAVTVVEMHIETEQRHQELLEFATQSDSQISHAASSTTQIGERLLQLSNSSSALSILPASPKIFHGREPELQVIATTLLANPARAAILGTGGMGKTTLSIAALHHPGIMNKYTPQYFVSCESASSCADLVAIIESYLGLDPSSQLSKAIVRRFSECTPSILVLDNFETPWEPVDSRTDVEEFLSLLTEVSHLGLLTRPFLPPLNPLPSFTSRQTFLEIADEPSADEESDLSQLLDLPTDNLPLAISLMANVAASEGYSTALSRWKAESTALLSDGYDKRSNLEKSIDMSLTSPRMATSPHAQDLLSLLSLLPDDISDEDLFGSDVPIPALAQCKSTLLRTSLVFVDHDKRLKLLSPIREYIGSMHPPSHSLALRQTQTIVVGDLVSRLISSLRNMHHVLLHGLSDTPYELGEVGRTILTLGSFSTSLARGRSPLFQYIPDLISTTGDSRLQWLYFVACRSRSSSWCHRPASSRGNRIFRCTKRLVWTRFGRFLPTFYNKLATHYENIGNYTKVGEFNKLGLALATEAGDVLQQLGALSVRPYLKRLVGNYFESLHAGQRAARLVGSLLDEAKTMCCLGRLSQILELCKKSHELLGTSVLDEYAIAVEVYDAEAEIQKAEYAEARRSYYA
ncbi:hypothetical protein C8R44DRAFT_730849 [Mycena epipterygia]|nr:hypothetical protein C8R44DRAFT_730849 [Mycena epipterygia]